MFIQERKSYISIFLPRVCRRHFQKICGSFSAARNESESQGGGVVGERVGVNVICSSDYGGDNEKNGGGGNANSSWRDEYKSNV